MNKIKILILCLGVCLFTTACSSSNPSKDESNEVSLSECEWGSVLQDKLNEIGVEEIKKVKDVTGFGVENINATVEIITNKDTLVASLKLISNKDEIAKWDVINISDKDDPKKLYYELAKLQLNEDGTQKHDIYDYKTGELLKEGKEIAKTDSSKADDSSAENSSVNSKDGKSNNVSSGGSSSGKPNTDTNSGSLEADTPKSPETPKPNDSSNGQNNALKSARNYLNTMAFSHSGLIKQLEYEGYSNQDATYAANNCGANWSDQALKSAKNYLDTMALSYSGLIKQLEYGGFSNQEATYGANNCGADWNQQAAKSARNYLDTMSFSRDGLINQLIYGGFSQEQAEFGATAVGY